MYAFGRLVCRPDTFPVLLFVSRVTVPRDLNVD